MPVREEVMLTARKPGSTEVHGELFCAEEEYALAIRIAPRKRERMGPILSLT
jgi:hypothetical protein